MASAFGYRGLNVPTSTKAAADKESLEQSYKNTPVGTPINIGGNPTYDTYLLKDLTEDNLSSKRFGGFWNRYGQQFAQPMMGYGEDIYNRAGTNAQLAGGMFNSAGQLQSMFDPRMGLGNLNAASGAFGAINPYLSNPNLPQSLDASGYMGMGQSLLNQAGAFNPMTAAADRFSTMESMLDPYRQRDMENMAQRGFMQGQLGSTGGAFSQMMNDYGAGVENQRQQNLLNAIQSSEATQGNMYNWGQGLSQLGLGAQGQGYNQAYQNAMVNPYLQQQGIGNAMQLAGSQANLGNLMSNLGLGAWNQSYNTQLNALGTQQGAYGLQQIMPNLYQNLYSGAQNYTAQAQFGGGSDGGGSGFGALIGGALGGIAGGAGSAIGGKIGEKLFG